jgi:small subunit ribosomal protein S16
MLRIRLSRTGKKRQASYRIVVAEKDAKRDGRIVERIGHYNPLDNKNPYSIQEDRALYWLKSGAQPSDAVRVLLNKQGTLARLERLHAGESLEALVAEYEGVTLPAAVPAAAAVAAAPAAETEVPLTAAVAEVITAIEEVEEEE